MEMKTYRAVDSNGRVFEVTMAKMTPPPKPVEFARAPEGSGYTRAPQKVGQ